jgi:hypothetical protein
MYLSLVKSINIVLSHGARSLFIKKFNPDHDLGLRNINSNPELHSSNCLVEALAKLKL